MTKLKINNINILWLPFLIFGLGRSISDPSDFDSSSLRVFDSLSTKYYKNHSSWSFRMSFRLKNILLLLLLRFDCILFLHVSVRFDFLIRFDVLIRFDILSRFDVLGRFVFRIGNILQLLLLLVLLLPPPRIDRGRIVRVVGVPVLPCPSFSWTCRPLN